VAGYESDDDAGDFIAFLGLVVAGTYFFYQIWRDHVAAGYGGGYFDPGPPPSDTTEGILNIFVPLNLSPTGAAFIKQQEGYRPTRYQDGRGHESIYYGHQIQPGEVIQGNSKPEADRLFAADAAKASKTVSDAVQVQLTQSQFDALADLVFNIGASAFLNSTLLRKLNSGDYAGAAQQFSAWVHSGGQVNNDLVARRTADQALFSGG
jgi:lysozyme